MRLQAVESEDKNALKELRKALRDGTADTVVESFSDRALLQFLKSYTFPGRCIVWWAGFGTLISVGYFLGAILHFWKPGQFPVYVFVPMWISFYLSKRPSDTWKPVEARLEMSSLPTLLDAYALNAPELFSAIREGVIKRLTLATREELERLTLAQRRQLVRFTLAQLRPDWKMNPPLGVAQRQAATLGYLALATLRQPGAEYPNRTAIESQSNLSEAIEEYLTALRKAN